MAGAKGGYRMTARAPGLHLLCGSFTTAGASAPAVVGPGFSVSAPATGVYTVTITDGKFAGCVSKFVSLEDATVNANDTVRFGDTDAVSTAGTFTIITASAAGTDADLTGPVVSFGLYLRNTEGTR